MYIICTDAWPHIFLGRAFIIGMLPHFWTALIFECLHLHTAFDVINENDHIQPFRIKAAALDSNDIIGNIIPGFPHPISF